MPQRQNMFLVCVTVGLVLLASKYRKNVLRSVKFFCHGIRNRGGNASKKNDNDDKGEFKIALNNIILADSPEKCDYAVQRIRCNSSDGILGFDCEWVNEGPVSLLQLATHNGVCALFRINKIGYIPTKLKELLASKNILKVGVAPFEDGQKVVNDYGCRVFGTLDLRTLAERFSLPCPKSLAALSLQYLSLEMDKVIEVRCGDWNADTLTDEQVAYAAYDAIASILIYNQIIKASKQKRSLWENFSIRVKSMWSKDKNTKFHDIPQEIIDTRFRAKKSTTLNNNTDKNNNANSITKGYVNHNIARKASSIPTRNKPLYHNCYLQAPDGETLCTCDRKKAKWYVARSLGVVVDEDPFTVRLKFEPSGRALGEVGQYYTQVKVNQCVVCGSSEKFIRKNVVPREYRKYFPLVMKAHQSHDVLLLCPSCHEISSSHDLQLRRKLAEMCDAPLIGPLTHTKEKQMSDWRKLHSAVKALRGKSTLPLRRRQELECYIAETTGHRDVNPRLLAALSEDLNEASFPPISTMDTAQPHGLKVVEYFQKEEGGLVMLERMWREHFLMTMNPKYLPSLWSVCHNQERLTIRQTQNRIEPEDARIAGLVC